MNSCKYCGANATIHLTDIVNKKRREIHLCEKCAQEHELLPLAPNPQLNLPALLQLLMLQGVGEEWSSSDAPDAVDPSTLTCPTCGLKYAQFRADGRFGCADDYDAFRTVLEPLLERVHRSLTHLGKVPSVVRRARDESERDRLRDHLRDAVAAENYEEAARLRDRIRQKEAAG